MEQNLNRDKISKLVILLLLVLALPLAAALVGQRQEVRKGAAGTGSIKLTLNPASGNKVRGTSFPVNVMLTAQAAKQIYAGEVQLQFISTVFDISGVACGGNFPLAVTTGVAGDKINLVCSRQGGAAAYSMAANTAVILGSFTATVKATAPLGATTIAFTSGKVPEGSTVIDLSDAGTTANYTITAAGTSPTNTPVPTATPTGGAGSCSAAAFTDNFTGNGIPIPSNSRWGTNLGYDASVLNGKPSLISDKLNISLVQTTANVGRDGNAYVKSLLSGDFSAEVDVTRFLIPTTASGNGNGVGTVNLGIEDPSRGKLIHLSWRRDATGVSYVDLATVAQTGGTPRFDTAGAKQVGNVSNLKLRLVRIGSTAYGYVNLGGTEWLSAGRLENVFTGAGHIMLMAYNFSDLVTGTTVADFDNFSLSCGPTTPTPTGGAGEIKIRFNMRGISTWPSIVTNRTLPFKVLVFTNPRSTNWSFTPTGTVDDKGFWTVTIQNPAFVLTDFPNKYDIFIKGPMHLMKKFSHPPIAGNGHPEYVDLPGMGPERYALDPGDLPIGGAGNVQDGVVNSLDAVYLSGCIATPDDAICLAKADLNLDGIINTMDMELLNGTVYSKWEDEVN